MNPELETKKDWFEIGSRYVLLLMFLLAFCLSAFYGEPIIVILGICCLSVGAFATGSALVLYGRLNRTKVLRDLALTILCLGALFSIAKWHWPFRLQFALAKPTLEDVARKVSKGETVKTPFRAGLITIRKAEISFRGDVCLWTDLNPTGPSGFIQCDASVEPGNLWSRIILTQDWQFINED